MRNGRGFVGHCHRSKINQTEKSVLAHSFFICMFLKIGRVSLPHAHLRNSTALNMFARGVVTVTTLSETLS